MREGIARLADGRSLSYAEYGDSEGLPFVFCHGTPGSRYDFTDEDDFCRIPGLRLITPERPGYGKSTPRPGRNLLSWAEDVEQLADHLGLERFVISGGSGGGPHALACAHRLPDRTIAALIFCSPAPTTFEGVRKPKSLGNRIGIWLAGTKLLTKLVTQNIELYKRQPDRFYNALVKAAGPADRPYFEDPEFRVAMIRTMDEAYAQGAAGHVDDAHAFTQSDWAFEPGEIQVLTYLWQGDQDRLVDPTMGMALQKRIPGAQLTMVAGAGHLLTERADVVRQVAEIVSNLKLDAPSGSG